jgi:sporulation protein YlmC with PRC-barrel domain
MSSERVSVVIRAKGRARGTARRAKAERPSGAQRLGAETISWAGGESGNGDRGWLIELDVDLRGMNLDPEYWLCNCHGFLVDSESGAEIGVVDDVELEPRSGRAVALVLASGWFGRSVRRISVADVQTIVPSQERLVVSDSEAPGDT